MINDQEAIAVFHRYLDTFQPFNEWGALNAAINRAIELIGEQEKLRAFVDAQANDEGLWFVAETASEAYLQQQLRLLHFIIEDE